MIKKILLTMETSTSLFYASAVRILATMGQVLITIRVSYGHCPVHSTNVQTIVTKNDIFDFNKIAAYVDPIEWFLVNSKARYL